MQLLFVDSLDCMVGNNNVIQPFREETFVIPTGGFPFVINIPASPSLLSNPRCIGTERNLLSCEIDDDSNCTDVEKAGIYCFRELMIILCVMTMFSNLYLGFPDFCTHGDVRITNFAIQICINGVWGSICSENFSEIEATVFCRQLGFPHGMLLEYKKSC